MSDNSSKDENEKVNHARKRIQSEDVDASMVEVVGKGDESFEGSDLQKRIKAFFGQSNKSKESSEE